MLPIPIQAPVPTLSLQKFDVDPENRTLDISGRASGVVGFLLNLFGVSPTTTLALGSDRVEMNESKISAQSRRVFPLAAIESTECGHRRSFAALVVSVVLAVLAIITSFTVPAAAVIELVLAGVFFLAFLMSRRLFLAIYCGDQNMQIKFKESKVNGVKIDREIAMEAIQIINDRVVETS